jgi:hypothetical protein
MFWSMMMIPSSNRGKEHGISETATDLDNNEHSPPFPEGVVAVTSSHIRKSYHRLQCYWFCTEPCQT